MHETVRRPDPALASPTAPGRPLRSPRFLGHGDYGLVLSASGTGASWWRDHALTSGPGDRLQDADGLFIAVRDLERPDGPFLGSGPFARTPVSATWTPGRIRLAMARDRIEVEIDVCVPAQHASELRRVTVRNTGRAPRRLELVSFANVVLNRAAAHASHPVFSKLFLQTEFLPGERALVVRRRPRAPDDVHPWLVHALLEHDPCAFESARDPFLGRGGRIAAPPALRGEAPAGTAGNVLDPIVSLRHRIVLEPGAEAQATFLLGAGTDRDDALARVRDLAGPGAVAAAFDAARDLAESRRAALDLPPDDAERFESLAAGMLWSLPALRRGAAGRIAGNGSGGDAGRHRRRGDLPLALGFARSAAMPCAVDLASAARWWHALGIPLETILIADAGRETDSLRMLDARAIPVADQEALRASARLVVEGPLPTLAGFAPVTASDAAIARTIAPAEAARSARPDLELWNGHGGFADDGREYVIRLRGADRAVSPLPPRPWTNVVANEGFGFLVSETGAGNVWCGNSREHRLTAWSNDPLLDPPADAWWIRDDDSSAAWSPLPGPLPAGEYEVRHGFGVTRWRHELEGLAEETAMGVPREDPVRITCIRITNTGTVPRRLSVLAAVRPVLGADPAETAGRLELATDPDAGAVYARNPFAGPFAGAVAFASVAAPDGAVVEVGTDRDAFFGTTGTAAVPAALDRDRLPAAGAASGDPLFAHSVRLEVPPGGTREVVFLLGQGTDRAHAEALVQRYRAPGAGGRALDDAVAAWHDLLGRVRIETPSRALDLMVNGWLPYQTVACRLRGRTAFYQSGGAYGFRDQLQDAAALVWLAPERTREQILLHAAHQFVEGDVLHWWHPPGTRGLRTRFADDLLWLPALTAAYVAATGDAAILDEPARFLRAAPLAPGEDEVFLAAEDSGESAAVHEHCCRAIDRSLAVGAHGLPLFGTGDWNDGMNRVGREGRGESVWMAFFLGTVLRDYAPLCRGRGDAARAARYDAHRAALAAAVERHAWDGEWYLRAFHDDGTPMGTAAAEECRIDALVQAWSVLSGMAPAARARQAMDAAERHLCSGTEGIIRLLAPPFDRTPQDPGYIKGYVRGVRENGGQYTHAALWVVMAMAQLGLRDRAAAWLERVGPLHHTATAERLATYQVEPYVVAADIYGAPPHVGRGGWTWYTGSAGWMYRAALESVLGLRLVDGTTLAIAPCIPDSWPGFAVTWRRPGTPATLRIRVRRGPQPSARLDGAVVPVDVTGAAMIPLPADGEHDAEIVLGPPAAGDPR